MHIIKLWGGAMVFFRQAINKNRFGGGDGLAEHINRITADNNIIGGGEYVVIRIFADLIPTKTLFGKGFN